MKKVMTSVLRASASASRGSGIGKFSVKSIRNASELFPSGPKLLILNDKTVDEIFEEFFSEKALKSIIYNTLQYIHKCLCADVDICVFAFNAALTSLAIETHSHHTALMEARERNAEPFEYETLMRKYKDACGKLIATYNSLPSDQQDELVDQLRTFVERKFLESGGILPVFLEIGELPADVDGALNAAAQDELTVAMNECAQSLSVIPFGVAHANVKIGPLQFGWYNCSEVVIKKADRVKKSINCPLFLFAPKPLWLDTFTACMLTANRFDIDLQLILHTCYSEFMSRFPTPVLKLVSEKIYHYNHKLEYDVIKRNCQHFALELITCLGLDCRFLTSEWLDSHIREFVQHPNSIMPNRMGATAAEFIEFVLKTNNKQIVKNNIGYAVVACGYWISDVQLQIGAIIESNAPSNEEFLELRHKEKVLLELYATLLLKFQSVQSNSSLSTSDNLDEVASGFSSAYFHSIQSKRERRSELRKLEFHDKLVSSLVFTPPPCSYTKTLYHHVLTTEEFSHPVYYTFVPSGTNKAKGTIIYSHGNAEDLGDVQPWLETLAARLNVNIIGYDYYGYGLSQIAGIKPQITHKTMFDDALSLWNHVKRQYKLTEDKVVLYGRSLGSAPTMLLASKFKYCGIILESPFTSILDVGLSKVGQSSQSNWFMRFFAATAVSNSEELIDNRRLTAMVQGTKALFIHGNADEVIPIEQSRILAAGIQSAYLVEIPNGTHNNLVSNFSNLLLDEIGSFLEKLNVGSRNPRTH